MKPHYPKSGSDLFTFDSTESKGLTCLIFNESQDKIKSPLHIFEQFSIVICEFRDSHV